MRARPPLFVHTVLVIACLGMRVAIADRLVTKGGETFQGTVIEERADEIVFDSLAAGRVTIRRDAIELVEREASPAPAEQQVEVPPANVEAESPAEPELVPTFQVDESEELSRASRAVARLYPLKGWKSVFTLGYTARRGQESDDRLEIRFRSEKKIEKNEKLLESEYDLANSVVEGDEPVRTDQRFKLHYQFRHNLQRQFFLQSDTTYYRDLLKDLRHEGTQTGGVGYRWRGESWTASATPSLGARVREVSSDWTTQAVGGVLQDFEWRLTKTMTLRQTLEYLFAPDEFTDSSRRFALELNQKLGAAWVLSFRYDYTYDAVVGAGSSNEQQRWSLTLGLEF